MAYSHESEHSVWTIAEAKARLSELLRHANEQPQYIGTKKPYVVVPVEQWEKLHQPAEPMGQWLIRNLQGGGELELPDRTEPDREFSFE
jgi:prevent-host-death family protein